MAVRNPEADLIPPITGNGGGGQPERVTVNLNGRASDALERAARITGESKTDAINRALIIYALLHEAQAANGAAYLRENKDADLERLRIL
jgi:hypothetical protein